MSNVAQIASSLPSDTTTFAANVVVFIAAVAAVVAGAWTAVTQIKKAILEGVGPGDKKADTKIASAMLMETTSLLMWSESNRDVCECIQGLKEEITALRHELEIHRALRMPPT